MKNILNKVEMAMVNLYTNLRFHLDLRNKHERKFRALNPED